MAQTVIYACDRCGKAVNHLWDIGITCEPIGSYAHRSAFHLIQKQQKAEWCEPCIDEMKVYRPLIRADQVTPPLTIEDIVRDIVKSEQNS